MATLPLKSSRNEQRAVIRFCGQNDLMQMRFTLRCVQCMATSVLRDQQYTFGVRSLLAAEKALLIRNERPSRHVATTDVTIAAVDAFVWSDGTKIFEQTWTIC